MLEKQRETSIPCTCSVEEQKDACFIDGIFCDKDIPCHCIILDLLIQLYGCPFDVLQLHISSLEQTLPRRKYYNAQNNAGSKRTTEGNPIFP